MNVDNFVREIVRSARAAGNQLERALLRHDACRGRNDQAGASAAAALLERHLATLATLGHQARQVLKPEPAPQAPAQQAKK